VADTWLPLAHRLLQAAGYEATLTEAAYALELAAPCLHPPPDLAAARGETHTERRRLRLDNRIPVGTPKHETVLPDILSW